jgi:hypothetical protein
MFVASRSVNADPFKAGSVAGNLASGSVPLAKLEAFKVVRPAPEPLIEVTDKSAEIVVSPALSKT